MPNYDVLYYQQLFERLNPLTPVPFFVISAILDVLKLEESVQLIFSNVKHPDYIKTSSINNMLSISTSLSAEQ